MKQWRNRLIVAAALGLGLIAMFGLVGGAATGQAAINPVELRLLGQTTWLADSTVGLQVMLTNHDTGEPLAGTVRVLLRPKDKTAEVANVAARARAGAANVQLSTVGLAPGQYDLVARAVTSAGMDQVERAVTIRREVKVMLTTDKPLYQPGQTIHLRALALQMPSLKPLAGEPLTLEVEDAKGNKVFKQAGKASRFGLAHAAFVLAHEVNMGRFTVRAVAADGRAEKTVGVERYVLPKFKVTLTTDRKYYRPGERVTGRVQADYFFGKPVSLSKVDLTVEAFEAGWQQVAEVKGTTDESGSYRFEVELPSYMVGQPVAGGQAVVKLTAVVTDRAKHEQQVAQSVPVSQGSLAVKLVPEGGRLQPGLPNVLYVATSTPDGQAAPAGVQIGVSSVRTDKGEAPLDYKSSHLTTDDLGLGRVTMRVPAVARQVTFRLTARGKAGEVEQTVTLPCRRYGQDDQPVALVLDRPLAKTGDRLGITAFTAGKAGSLFLDVVRDRQTVLTRTLEVRDGKAETSLVLTPDLEGLVTVSAYRVSPSENVIRDSRLVWVQGANDLLIEAKPDKETYRPGEEAAISFQVSDRSQHPVLAALGIAVVDEAVFALSEMQPGLEQLYFRLERELMAPRYEIHGLGLGTVLREPPRPVAKEQQQRALAAGFLFASAPTGGGATVMANSYTDRWAKLRKQLADRVEADRKAIEKALKAYYAKHRRYLSSTGDIRELVEEGLLPAARLKDQFGTPYQVSWTEHWVMLISAGPDRKMGNDDDVGGPDLMEEDAALPGGLGIRRRVEALGAVPPMALAPMAKAAMDAKGAVPTHAGAAEPEVRVREFFPETMFVEPALITDERGRATVRMTVADSITTWRLTALGSSLDGRLGSLNTGLRCFQDFFVDIDLPVALTQGDEVSIPVAIYNYLPGSQTVTLTLEKQEWFTLTGPAEQQVQMAKNAVDVVYYPIKVKDIGVHKLTVHAKGSKLSDAIRREIEVLPDGQEVRDVENGRLQAGKPFETKVTIPARAIPGASQIFVKLYPGTFSQVVEGLDKIFRMPNGCFEQTSSVTYPNVLVLDYLKATKQAKPELEMKAAQYINVGYQRLVSYEVRGGGFSWFGDAPAHKVLTAYGLLEFHDMAKVHEVDPAVISRTQEWLAGRQQADGSWEVDRGGIAEGIINRQTDTVRVTGYIAWALAETGYKGPATGKALDWLRGNYRDQQDPYALAVILNAFSSSGEKGAEVDRVAEALAEKAVVEGDTAYWKSSTPTFTGADGKGADLETTALATYALLKSGQQGALVNKALLYLTKQKDSYGTWSTTQATVWGLKALLLAMGKATEEINATVTITANGKQAGSFRLTPENADVMRQLDLGELVRAGANEITISAEGKGSVLYQVVSKYYLPWSDIRPGPKDVLDIKVAYDRTSLAQNDLLGCHVEVTNLTARRAQMVVIDLGLPPGFDLVPDGLEAAVEKKAITKYTPAARQIIVYTDGIDPHAVLKLDYQLRAKYPLRARTTKSRAYLYYNPDQEAFAGPVGITVQ